MTQALSGIRVIDLTNHQAGPSCGQMLAWLGADVIKVEEPVRGDIARQTHRDRPDCVSLFFLSFNANKRSLPLNLKSARAKEVFRALERKGAAAEPGRRSRGAGAASREGPSRWLRECGGGRWGGAKRRAAVRAGPVGGDGLHGEGVLDGGEERSQHKGVSGAPEAGMAPSGGAQRDIMKRAFSRVAPPRRKDDGTRCRDA